MSETKNHTEHLSESDLKAYLAGALRGKEANRIERHLESCELCSEALEGIGEINSNDFSADVRELNQMISEKSESRSKTNWFIRIAAGLSFLILATYLLVNYLDQPADQEFAASENQELTDSLSTDTEPLALSQEATEQDSQSIKTDSSRETELGLAHPATDAKETATEEEIEEPVIAQIDETETEEGLGHADLVLPEPEKVVEELAVQPEVVQEDKPIAIANEPAKEEETTAGSRRAKRSVSAEPLEAAPTQSAVALDALVELPKISIQVLPGQTAFDQNAEPVSGVDQYIQAIRENLTYPVEAAEAGINGSVILEFEVRADSVLALFEIINSLGFGCDEEAKRVIREGPKWNPALQQGEAIPQKVRAVIPFPSGDR